MTTTITDRADWASALLTMLGAPTTPNNVDTIVDWETAEGGAGPQFGVKGNITNYNPINISLTSGAKGYGYDPGTGTYYPGASPTPGNSPPIASFSNWGTGLTATAARLQEPFAKNILADLKANDPTNVTAAAVGQSGWGTGDFASGGTNSKVINQGSGGTVDLSSPAGASGGSSAAAPGATLDGPGKVFQDLNDILNPTGGNIVTQITSLGTSDIKASIEMIVVRGLLTAAFIGLTYIGFKSLTGGGGSAIQIINQTRDTQTRRITAETYRDSSQAYAQTSAARESRLSQKKSDIFKPASEGAGDLAAEAVLV